MRRKENKAELHETKRFYEVPSEKVQDWSDTIEKLNKKCYAYKAENDTMIDEVSWYKAKASRLERENKALRTQADAYFEKWQELESEIYDRNEWDLLKMEQEDNQC